MSLDRACLNLKKCLKNEFPKVLVVKNIQNFCAYIYSPHVSVWPREISSKEAKLSDTGLNYCWNGSPLTAKSCAAPHMVCIETS